MLKYWINITLYTIQQISLLSCIPLVNKTVRNVQSCKWHFQTYIHNIFASFFFFFFFGDSSEKNWRDHMLFTDICFALFFHPHAQSERLMGLTPLDTWCCRADLPMSLSVWIRCQAEPEQQKHTTERKLDLTEKRNPVCCPYLGM